jgi:hypothetical protein
MQNLGDAVFKLPQDAQIAWLGAIECQSVRIFTLWRASGLVTQIILFVCSNNLNISKHLLTIFFNPQPIG